MTHDERPTLPGGMLGVLAVVRFLAEVAMLVALGWGGWRLGSGGFTSALLAAALPLLAAAVWGRWVAPRASARLDDPARWAVEIVLFGVAGTLMIATVEAPQGVVLALVLWAAYVASAWVGRQGY